MGAEDLNWSNEAAADSSGGAWGGGTLDTIVNAGVTLVDVIFGGPSGGGGGGQRPNNQANRGEEPQPASPSVPVVREPVPGGLSRLTQAADELPMDGVALIALGGLLLLAVAGVVVAVVSSG